MNQSRTLHPRAILLAFSIIAALGCAAGTSVQHDARPTGLPDGINDQFLSDNLDVEAFVERFEGESREVYAGRRAIVTALEIKTGGQIADIGAGTGFFSRLLAEAVGASGAVHAVEISPKFLEHLRDLKATEKIDQLHIVEGTGNSVELATASIDLAFICDVYHHFEAPSDSLASVRDAIRPGGSLVLIEFERIPGTSPDWLLNHVRAGKEVFQSEIEEAGFKLTREIHLDELSDNYMLQFERIADLDEN